MSWTYDDDLDEAIGKWADLPESRRKDELARSLLKRYWSIRQEDCGHMRLPSAYPDDRDRFPKFNIRPPIPKELQ